MTVSSSCPRLKDLEQFLLGQILESKAGQIEQHLLHCARCVATLNSMTEEGTLVAALRHRAGAGEVPQGPEVETLVQRLRQVADLVLANASGAATPSRPGLGKTPAPNSPVGDWPTQDQARPDLAGLRPAESPGELGRLGPYRLGKVLGEGGMGLVLAAEDLQLRRSVALKVMKPELARNPVCRERFLREARAAAAIEHDHIVTIFQVGEDNGIPYLAMPLLQGESLQARGAREGPLPWREVLRIGREIAEGLAAAHERGLIHRDIKPGNIWLETGSGRVKILDFGLAFQPQADVQLTQVGQILGTPAFMAPEQARQTVVDARSDLFSLGIILYWLSTGRLPFPQKDPIALLAAVALDPPTPLAELTPAVPRGLANLVGRLLAKDPAARPSSARAVIAAIRKLEQGQLPLRAGRHRRAWAGAAVAAGLVGVIGYLWGPVIYRIVTDRGELTISADDPEIQVIVKQGGKLVQIVDLRSRQSIDLPVGNYEIELTGGGQGWQLSADHFTLTRGGKSVVTVARVPAAGPGLEPGPREQPSAPVVGEVRTFAGHTGVVAGVAFGGNDNQAVSGSWDKSVRLWNVATGKELGYYVGHRNTIRTVAVSPDGNQIASGGFDQTVRLWDLSRHSGGRVLNGHDQGVTSIAFAPDGRRLVSAGLDRTVQVWNVKNAKGLGRLLGAAGPLDGVALSPDGRFVLGACQDTLVYLWDLEGENQVGVWRGHAGGVNTVAFAPSGRFALSGSSDQTIRIWEVPGGQERHCLALPAEVQSAVFTPDGKRVLAGCRDGTLRLWDVASATEVRCFTGHQGRVWSVAISRDGRFALSGSSDHTARLWGLPPAK